MAAKSSGVVDLGSAQTYRRPRTEEEFQIIYDLDMAVFDELTDMWDAHAVKRDPAYLVWAVRRHFFWHFWGDDIEFPEARPAKGSTPVPCCDKEKPWYVPGLEKIKRNWYPEGWDDYVNSGIKPVRRLLPVASVAVTPSTPASTPAVPKASGQSERLLAAKKMLKEQEEAKELREIEARMLALKLEEATMKEKMARQRQELAAMEAEKAAIHARFC